jgi:tetratricopeptide (TPR) repeat protein
MGLFDRLFGRKSTAAAPQVPAPAVSDQDQDDSQQPDIDPALAPALAAFQRGEHQQTLQLTSVRLDAGADAYRLCALSRCKLNRYADALPYLEKLFDYEPSAHNALQLATSTVMTGQLDAGEAWLGKFAQINHSSKEIPPALARSNFISALQQAGLGAHTLPHLQWLRSAYAALSITDPTFICICAAWRHFRCSCSAACRCCACNFPKCKSPRVISRSTTSSTPTVRPS